MNIQECANRKKTQRVRLKLRKVKNEGKKQERIVSRQASWFVPHLCKNFCVSQHFHSTKSAKRSLLKIKKKLI